MADEKYVTIRTFKTDSARKGQLDGFLEFPDKIYDAKTLTDVVTSARVHKTHQYVSYYDEQGTILKDYPTAAKYLGGKEGLFGIFS